MNKRKRGILGQIDESRGSFAVVFFLMFVLCVVFLAAADALPERQKLSTQVQNLFAPVDPGVSTGTTDGVLEAPLRVVARSVGLEVTVSNPQSTSVAALDEALLKGAIRYPTSAYLGQNGTVALFGHSSSLPVIYNQNFKAFNGIQNLKQGSIVSVYSGTYEYRYAVTGVRLADTTDATEALVELPQNGRYLVLVTCNNSFGTKTSRYIVTAEFVEAYSLSN